MPAQVVTDELRRWIIEQARAGCTPESVRQAMRASGWSEAAARDAMAQTLEPAQQPAARVRLPEPALSSHPSLIHAGDRAVKLVFSMKHPRVVVFADLLSRQECEALIEQARPRLSRSETVRHADGRSEVNEARTSSGMFFRRGESPLIATIEARIARLLEWPVDHGEGLQILHYQPGAEYRPHYDYFDPDQPGTAAVLKRGGQRVGTLVMYLNTPTQGGGTTFPDVGLEVAPLQGHAVFFSYDRPDPATRTLHGGAPVLQGEKWVATKWLRTGVFT